MRVTESLLLQNNRKKIENNKNYEDEDPTQTYQEKGWEYWALNQQKTVFTSPMDDGLNSRGSVFEEKAVFRTKEGKR